jgi:serine/threonine-protein kinase RsbW
MQIDLAVDMKELERMTAAVEAFCDENEVPPDAAMHLVLVLEELFTNIVTHGYKDRTRIGEPIRIALTAKDDRVSVGVSDDGIAFDPLQAATPDLDLDVEDRPIGGLGIHFMRTMMVDLHYARQNERNQLNFSKVWTR